MTFGLLFTCISSSWSSRNWIFFHFFWHTISSRWCSSVISKTQKITCFVSWPSVSLIQSVRGWIFQSLKGPVCRIQWHLVVKRQIATNQISLRSSSPSKRETLRRPRDSQTSKRPFGATVQHGGTADLLSLIKQAHFKVRKTFFSLFWWWKTWQLFSLNFYTLDLKNFTVFYISNQRTRWRTQCYCWLTNVPCCRSDLWGSPAECKHIWKRKRDQCESV